MELDALDLTVLLVGMALVFFVTLAVGYLLRPAPVCVRVPVSKCAHCGAADDHDHC